jgi:hypothetical protein
MVQSKSGAKTGSMNLAVLFAARTWLPGSNAVVRHAAQTGQATHSVCDAPTSMANRKDSRMKTFARPAGLLLLALAMQPGRAQDSPAGEDMQVTVERRGAAISISVDMTIAAGPRQVWQVLTDYDHMAAFSPSLTSSRAEALGPNRLRVEQSGVVHFGFLRFPFETVREVELEPDTAIRSRAVAGTIRSGFAETRLRQRGKFTDIEYRSESVPAVRLPFGLGMGAVRERTREQFASLRSEILRRMQEPAQVR